MCFVIQKLRYYFLDILHPYKKEQIYEYGSLLSRFYVKQSTLVRKFRINPTPLICRWLIMSVCGVLASQWGYYTQISMMISVFPDQTDGAYHLVYRSQCCVKCFRECNLRMELRVRSETSGPLTLAINILLTSYRGGENDILFLKFLSF